MWSDKTESLWIWWESYLLITREMQSSRIVGVNYRWGYLMGIKMHFLLISPSFYMFLQRQSRPVLFDYAGCALKGLRGCHLWTPCDVGFYFSREFQTPKLPMSLRGFFRSEHFCINLLLRVIFIELLESFTWTLFFR